MFNPFVMIQDVGDDRAWVCGSYETEASLKDARAVIAKHKQYHVVLCAWITDRTGDVVFFENYTNVFGWVNNKDVRLQKKTMLDAVVDQYIHDKNLPDEEDE